MDFTMLLAQAGPSVAFLSLLLWIARMYYKGDLVTRATINDLKENFKQQIARERAISDSYREADANRTEALFKLSNQNERLLEGQKTVEAFILSLSQRQPRELSSGTGGGRE